LAICAVVPYVPAPEPALAGFAVDNTALDNGAIFSTNTRRLLGVHILGEGATELIHIGQAVLNLKGTIDYFIQNTFNYPTLAEA
jgi:pyruvate/2-oxoglutarate dehydrogenase complex dihydrolipoamide dehydrogenase (E3) component